MPSDSCLGLLGFEPSEPPAEKTLQAIPIKMDLSLVQGLAQHATQLSNLKRASSVYESKLA